MEKGKAEAMGVGRPLVLVLAAGGGVEVDETPVCDQALKVAGGLKGCGWRRGDSGPVAAAAAAAVVGVEGEDAGRTRPCGRVEVGE